MEKRAIISAFLAVAMMASATGCSNGGGTSSAAASGSEASSKLSGKLTFTAINGGDTEVKAFTEILNGFEKETGVKVQLEELPNSNDYENIVKTRFATNDPPDIFYFYSGSNQYTNMKASTSLVDLTNEPFVKNLTSAVKEYQTVDGKIYGMPWGSYNALGVFYNKKVFEKCGITAVPNNYADFLKICETIKSKGVTPIFEGANTVWPTQIFTLCGFQTFVNPSIGGDTGVNKIVNNQMKLKDIPALKDVMSRYVALKSKGYMNKNIASATYDQEEKAISDGSAAMIFQADWCLPDIEGKYKNADDIGYFPLPSDTGKGVASLYPPKQIFVSKAGKNLPAAMALEQYLAKQESLNTWYKYNPGIAVYSNATSKQYTSQKDIVKYIDANQGEIQIQLRIKAGFADFDKICQELILSGNVDKAVQTLNNNYLKDGKDKQITGF